MVTSTLHAQRCACLDTSTHLLQSFGSCHLRAIVLVAPSVLGIMATR